MLLTTHSPTFAAIVTATHLERLFTRFRNAAVAVCVHSVTRTLVKSGQKAWSAFGVSIHLKNV